MLEKSDLIQPEHDIYFSVRERRQNFHIYVYYIHSEFFISYMKQFEISPLLQYHNQENKMLFNSRNFTILCIFNPIYIKCNILIFRSEKIVYKISEKNKLL